MAGKDRHPVETFAPDERERLAPYFTNLDGPVFALVNLPEVVKGALFARYSRSPKSLRRLFLDEFLDDVAAAGSRSGYTPSAEQWAWFAVSGLLGSAGHYCLTRAFALADLSVTQPITQAQGGKP